MRPEDEKQLHILHKKHPAIYSLAISASITFFKKTGFLPAQITLLTKSQEILQHICKRYLEIYTGRLQPYFSMIQAKQ